MTYYSTTGYLLIQTSKECLVCSPEEVEALQVIERPDNSHGQSSHILSIYPTAKATIVRLIRECTSHIEAYESLKKNIGDICALHIKDISERDRAEEFYTRLYVDIPEEKVSKKLHTLEKMIRWQHEGDSASLVRAKAYPISDLLTLNTANFARCIWHQEKTASLKYYPDKNRVHCYGCNKGGDAVDVYSTLYNCSISESIQALS